MPPPLAIQHLPITVRQYQRLPNIQFIDVESGTPRGIAIYFILQANDGDHAGLLWHHHGRLLRCSIDLSQLARWTKYFQSQKGAADVRRPVFQATIQMLLSLKTYKLPVEPDDGKAVLVPRRASSKNGLSAVS
jgi:hypothetical protein